MVDLVLRVLGCGFCAVWLFFCCVVGAWFMGFLVDWRCVVLAGVLVLYCVLGVICAGVLWFDLCCFLCSVMLCAVGVVVAESVLTVASSLNGCEPYRAENLRKKRSSSYQTYSRLRECQHPHRSAQE